MVKRMDITGLQKGRVLACRLEATILTQAVPSMSPCPVCPLYGWK